MPHILKLPDELLLDIIVGLQRDDLENFTLTCKRLFNVGHASLQEHRTLKQKYSKILSGTLLREDFEEDVYRKHPIHLLLEVLENPTIVEYPIKMIVGDCEHEDNEYHDEDTVMPDCREAISAAVSQCAYVRPRQRESITNEIILGRVDATVALLLTILPNLVSVEFYNLSTNSVYLLDVLWSIAGTQLGIQVETVVDENAESTRDESANEDVEENSFEGSQALTKLTHILVDRYDPGMEGNEDFCLLAPFVALPSARSLSGAMIEGSWFPTFGRRLESGLKDITLTESCFDPEVFDLFISKIAALTSFTFHFARTVRSETEWNPRSIIQSLTKHQGDSLEKLDLAGDDRGKEHFIGSLTEFRNLKVIRIESTMFIEEAKVTVDDKPPNSMSWPFNLVDRSLSAQAHDVEQVHRVVDLLPRSVQTLTMTDWKIGKAITLKMMEGLAASKTQEFPVLRLLEFEKRVDLPLEVRDSLEKAGIEVRHPLEDSHRMLVEFHEKYGLQYPLDI